MTQNTKLVFKHENLGKILGMSQSIGLTKKLFYTHVTKEFFLNKIFSIEVERKRWALLEQIYAYLQA